MNFPGIQGGPLMHVIAAKAVCFHEASSRRSGSTPSACWTTRRRWPPRCWSAASGLVSGGTDNHLLLVNCRAQRTDR